MTLPPLFAQLLRILISVFVIAAPAFAQSPVLTVTIATGTDPITKSYSLTELDALPQTEVRTGNDFVDGIKPFTGPLVRDLIGDGPQGKLATLIAVNDYEVDVPLDDFRNYPVILATRMGGELLSPRDKGPIWVIYPMSDFDELRDNSYNARLIWQLSAIEVR